MSGTGLGNCQLVIFAGQCLLRSHSVVAKLAGRARAFFVSVGGLRCDFSMVSFMLLVPALLFIRHFGSFHCVTLPIWRVSFQRWHSLQPLSVELLL